MYEDLKKAVGVDLMSFTFDVLLNWALPLVMVVDHRNKTPETMEVLQNEWTACCLVKITPYHRALDIKRLKKKLEMLTESSDDTTEQKIELEMEITRLESETLEERNQRKEEEDRKKEDARKRKEEARQQKEEEEAQQQKEEEDRKKEDARKRKAQRRKVKVRQRKEEQKEQETQAQHEARQQKKEQEEQARQRKKEQEEQAPKARGKNKTFDNRMEDLKRYKETHGHVNVSIPVDKSLAQFCVQTRCTRNNPGKSKSKKLTIKNIARLDALGFNWMLKEYVMRSFDERIEDLEKYKRTHGHLSLKKHEDSSLYQFCADVRHSLNQVEKDGTRKLTVERIARLDALGFKWAKTLEASVDAAPEHEK
jgi:outer membrane biosynthesis protein TonB